MLECSKCGKQYKKQFHLDKHMKKCTVIEVPSGLEGVEDIQVNNVLPEVVMPLEVSVCNYYEGHIRRKFKLMGLLSSTLDKEERRKIQFMIAKLL